MPERDAIRTLWTHRMVCLAALAGNAALLACVYGWFWIPDEKVWHLVLSAVSAAAILAGWVWLWVFTLSRILVRKPGWRVLLKPRFWTGCAVVGLAGFWLPWKLVWWVPPVEGFLMQAGSMAVRFGIAWFLAVTATLWLLALAGRLADTGGEAAAEPS